ncbi:N-acetylmuramoyl-L-alanine amidase [Nocardiopsis sp. FIRDI 009]|uniref:peptidoglycan recognition protein family protein n=1 Tax=Nocardiopsis sp. FIRDI 009 TaxID=714197 RepID=UPI001E35320B|nr:N-acetylmuramoyl-L-alanine amidase [Nocardiopsis sp. FIRDI 009]
MQLLVALTTVPVMLGLVIESASTVGIPTVIGSSGRPRSGRVVHYNGGPLTWGSHANCRAQVRQMHAYHRARGWAGIGYHLLICWHGVVLTGRGIYRVGAHAPGANASHVGVQFMLGGSQRPSAAQLAAFVALAAWLAARGVKASVTGHRDWNSTSCPGDHLYRRVRSGDWGSGDSGDRSVPPAPTFSYWTVAGVRVPTGDPWLLRGMRGTPVLRLQEGLKKWRPSLLPQYGADGSFGQETEDAVEALQRARGIRIDGVYGTESAAELRRALSSSASKPSGPDPLVVDGRLGELTAKAVQRALQVEDDGVWGPVTVRAMQLRCGLRGRAVDGILGPQTTRAVQRRVGLTSRAVDGIWPSVRAVSKAGIVTLNSGVVSQTTRELQKTVNARRF